MPEMSEQYKGNGDVDILAQDAPGAVDPELAKLVQQAQDMTDGIPPVPPSVKSWPTSTHTTTHSDGSTADYYELPADDPKELQDLISYRDMNGQIAEIFRACYRYGQVAHSPKLRDAKKILFYAKAEVARLEKYGE